MPGPPPEATIALTRRERHELERIARKATAAQRDVTRARIVLLAAEGRANAEIARALGCARNTVRTWRARFAERRLEGLADLPRPGRPPTYGDRARVVVKAIACELPAARGLPLSRLSLSDVHGEARRELRPCPSRSTIGRWLQEDALKPWRNRSWVFPRDPAFYGKASKVLDLYHRVWEGEPLTDEDVVLCADEKRIQMLRRTVPTAHPAPGRPMRVEHEYERLGVLVYLAALDVRRGKVIGECVPSTHAASFQGFVDGVMAREPCRSARRVFWIVDNGSAHDPRSFPGWLAERHPKAVAVHLPVHASWLNQVEIYFSIVEEKVLTPMDLPGVRALPARLSAFEGRYNRTAGPFAWTFTKRDLRRLLDRLDEKA